MASETVEEKLDRLADYKAQLDAILLQKREIIAAFITTEIHAQINSVEVEFQPKLQAVDENITALENEIKNEVLTIGKTQRGAYLMAVLAKGRSGGFDTKMLDGMSKLIPQINEARKPDGEPSVSFRAIDK